jgi:hypothetical protein
MNIVAAISLATAPAYAVVYSGSLSSADGGLTGIGSWNSGINLEWTVSSLDIEETLWNYEYTLTVPLNTARILHVITEVSPVFERSNILGEVQTPGCLSFFRVDDFTPDENCLDKIFNQGLPEAMRGIQVSSLTGFITNELTWSFDSDKNPVWGDMFAKGLDPCEPSYLYNTGFTASDPPDPASDGSIDFHLLVPDSASSQEAPPLPEPSTSVLGALGLLMILRHRKD